MIGSQIGFCDRLHISIGVLTKSLILSNVSLTGIAQNVLTKWFDLKPGEMIV